jgi:hypothetical protein
VDADRGPNLTERGGVYVVTPLDYGIFRIRARWAGSNQQSVYKAPWQISRTKVLAWLQNQEDITYKLQNIT